MMQAVFAAPQPPHAGLGGLDYVMVLLYLAGTIGIAVYFARQHGSTEEFFLGGRRMPWFAVGLSIMATLMSTISYLGSPGEIIKHGIGIFLGQLAIPLNVIIVFTLIVPFFMRMRLTSAYEYLELRFNYPARLLGAVLFVFMRVGWMSVVVYTASLALTEMTRETVPAEMRETLIYWIIGGVGVFATVYAVIGGIRAVIWTDVVQFLVLAGGAILTLVYIVWTTGTGPFDWWQAASQVNAEHTSPPLFSADITTRRTVFTAVMHALFWTICTHASDQVVLQRYFATTSLKAARRSYLLAAGADWAVGILLSLCGLALLYFYVNNPTYLPIDPETGGHFDPASNYADKVFPYFIGNQLPAGLGGLILAALIAAAMSSIDSGVNSVSAVLTTDIFQRLYAKGSEKMSELALARTLTLAIGFGCTLLACGVARIVIVREINIIDVMQPAFNMFLGPMAALFFIGMFLPRCSARSAIPGVLVGIAVTVVWSYWTTVGAAWNSLRSAFDVAWLPAANTKVVPTITLAVAAPCLAAIATAGILSYIVERNRPSRGSAYGWWAVVRGSGEPETRE